MRDSIFKSGDVQSASESTVTRPMILNERVVQMPDIQPVTSPSWWQRLGPSVGSWAPPVLAAIVGFVGVLMATSYVLDRGIAEPGATEAGSGEDADDAPSTDSSPSLQSQVVQDASRGSGPDGLAGSDETVGVDSDGDAATPSLAAPSSITTTTSTLATVSTTTEQSVSSVTTTVTSVSTTVAPVETTGSSTTTPSSTETASTETSITTTMATTSTTTSTPPSVTEPVGDHAQQVLALTNVERLNVGCPELTLNSQLNAAAVGHSADMAARDFFDHVDPEGRDAGSRIDASGYQWQRWGENIAVGHQSAADVVQGWMNSDGHRANILNCDFRELGVGHATNGATGNRPYWTQVFGSPR